MAATFRFCTEAAGEHHVHLIDVEAVVLDEVTVLVDLSVQLAAGTWRVVRLRSSASPSKS